LAFGINADGSDIIGVKRSADSDPVWFFVKDLVDVVWPRDWDGLLYTTGTPNHANKVYYQSIGETSPVELLSRGQPADHISLRRLHLGEVSIHVSDGATQLTLTLMKVGVQDTPKLETLLPAHKDCLERVESDSGTFSVFSTARTEAGEAFTCAKNQWPCWPEQASVKPPSGWIWLYAARAGQGWLSIERKEDLTRLRYAGSGRESSYNCPDTTCTITPLPVPSETWWFKVTSPIRPVEYWEFLPKESRISVRSKPCETCALLQSKLQFAKSADGTKIPVSVAWNRTKFVPDSPTLLRVYGAYGAEERFELDKYSRLLMDRGTRLAAAHVRGGGYYGQGWHAAASGVRRTNGIQDVLAVAETLSGTNRTPIILIAKSAGALVALGALRAKPELFAGLILENPFVSVAASLARGDATALRESHEWGALDKADESEAIRSFDPAQNKLPPGSPPILLKVALNDQNVPSSDTLLWIQNERKANPQLEVFLQTSETADHSGEAHEGDFARDQALNQAFVEYLGQR
jgi:protease II